MSLLIVQVLTAGSFQLQSLELDSQFIIELLVLRTVECGGALPTSNTESAGSSLSLPLVPLLSPFPDQSYDFVVDIRRP